MTTDAAIHVRGLEKSFKKLRVLRGVDFDVARGSIFALLGSNGAGNPLTELRHSLPPGAVAGPAGYWPWPGLWSAAPRRPPGMPARRTCRHRSPLVPGPTADVRYGHGVA